MEKKLEEKIVPKCKKKETSVNKIGRQLRKPK